MTLEISFFAKIKHKNKATMFGLEGESLRKQFGELFLARLQRLTFRLVEGHQATWPLNSKGAMFGLDARIALAIFGALSVIVGASLYSAIENARATAILTELEEVGKAWAQYHLDTGEEVPFNTTGINGQQYKYVMEELITSTKRGWKGPYLNFKLPGPMALISPLGFAVSTMSLKSDDSWTSSGWANGGCEVSKPCFLWIYAYNIPDDALAKKIDIKVDGNDGPNLGSFRYYCSEDGFACRYMLKIMPVINKNTS